MDASHVRSARALLRWSQSDLAERSGVSVPTIKRLEAMEGELVGHATTINALASALSSAGVIFLGDGELIDGGPGVRLQKSS
ncbi:transcriptional regulator [Metarhizobium album]|uniref:Transcriptional regulator n=1 Tax=Metarhizobium album TaxID=2182425 RepID=A0A2U2DHL3_9HYPH|nr:helix-turn-helix transcriptional regulator [Rhizobium album]PWE52790.1 transcriptional regulator [Rhizobium album]